MVDVNRIGSNRHLYGTGIEVMIFMVIHDIHGSYKGREVAPGFIRQVIIDVPEVSASSGAVYGLAYVSGAAVVGSYGQIPFAEYFIEVFQVFGRGIGSFDRIPSLVDKRIDCQSINPGCAVHELPKTRCTGP